MRNVATYSQNTFISYISELHEQFVKACLLFVCLSYKSHAVDVSNNFTIQYFYTTKLSYIASYLAHIAPCLIVLKYFSLSVEQ